MALRDDLLVVLPEAVRAELTIFVDVMDEGEV